MIHIDEEIVEHMTNPRNYGSMDDADAIGIGENPLNSEKVILYIKVDNTKESPVIEDIKFQALACMTTVVAGSIITGEAKGLDFEMGEKLISATLGMLDGVPPEEAACSEMVALALKGAMDHYMMKQDSSKEIPAVVYKIESDCVPLEERNLQAPQGE